MNDSQWQKNTDAGKKALYQGLYDEAEQFFLAALKEAERLGSTDPRLFQSLNYLACTREGQGKYAEAEPLYERMLALAEPDSDDALITVLNSLAWVYRKQNKYAEAERHLKRSLTLAEKALANDPYSDPAHMSYIGGMLAELYCEQGRYAEAGPFYKREVALLEMSIGPSYPAMAEHLHNLAMSSVESGNYGIAEALFKRSLEIAEISGSGHADVAYCLENYADLLRRTNRLAEAERLELRANEIRSPD